MKGLAITNIGIEKVASKEIKELIKAKTSVKKGAVSFDLKELSDLCVLCYKGQSVSRIILLLKQFKIKKIEDLKQLEKIDFTEYLDSKQSFASRCMKIGGFSSREIEEEVGAIIIDSIKKKTKRKQKVNLENPDVTFFSYVVDNEVYFGIDFASVDLSKRHYKIFGHQRSLKGTIAYSLLRLANYDNKKILVDTFCNDGSIPIEASLFASGFPVNYYDKDRFAFLKLKQFKGLDFDKFFEKYDKVKKIKEKIYAFDSEQRFVKTAEKNAKIAGVLKNINFARIEVEWLDTKFKKSEVDLIITNPPRVSKQVKKQDFIKLFKELFYQADYVLKEKGKIAVIAKDMELLKTEADKYNFKAIEELDVNQGKDILKIAIFMR